MPKPVTDAKKKTVYAEGRKAFEKGTPRGSNPYAGKKDEVLALIWWYGWDTAKKDSLPIEMPDDPDKTIPRLR